MAVKLKKKLVMLSLSADSPEGVRSFYETLFGMEFAESLTDRFESYHAPIDENGIDFTINPTFPGGQAGVVPYYAVDDLDSAMNEATAAGGRVVFGPADLPISPGERSEYKQRIEEFFPDDARGATDWDIVGSAGLVIDPDGNPVGLVQLAQHTQGRFKAGKHKRDLDEKQERVHRASIDLGEKHRQRRGGPRR
jgi:predicted enzyme related to lactoylglutathione lyase